jgi:hypothetical protein
MGFGCEKQRLFPKLFFAYRYRDLKPSRRCFSFLAVLVTLAMNPIGVAAKKTDST